MATSADWKDNPYIIGRPIYEPELFFGREELFQFLTDHLNKHAKVILLYGQRRIGKSTVLRQVPNFVHLQEFVFVPFDLQDQTRLPLSRVLHNLAKDIVDHLGLEKVTPPLRTALEANPNVFDQDFLPQVYQALNGRNLVLLLDEFDVLSDYRGDASVTAFFPYLHSIIYRQEPLFIVPVVGRRLDELQTLLSLFREAPQWEICLLEGDSAQRLITKPAEGVLQYTPEAIQAILDLSSGHPYFTQLLCHLLFARAREQQEPQVLPAHVESIVERAISSGEGGLVWFREGLPISERVIFSAVAEVAEKLKQESAKSHESKEVLLQRLVKAFTGNAVGALYSTTLGVGPIKRTFGAIWDVLGGLGVVQTEALRNAEEHLLRWGYLREINRTKLWITQAYAYEVTIELVRRWLVNRHPLKRALWELESLDPKAEQIFTEAIAARQRGDGLSALKLYTQVLEANPNHFRALFERAELSLELEEFGSAAELYARAYRIDPFRAKEGFVRALINFGRDCMLQGQFDRAKEQFQKVLAVEPENALARKRLEEAEAGAQRALAARNPFMVGGLVYGDQFVGREREVQTILSQLQSSGSVAVYGERRMGKTSLLRHIAAEEVWQKHGLDLSRVLTVSVDCQAVSPFSPTYFWREVLEELQLQVEEDEELATLIPDLLHADELSGRSLRRLLRLLGRRQRILVLLIDEFEVVLQTHSSYSEQERLTFLAELRQMAASAELAVVVATRRRLSEFGRELASSAGSPFYNHYLFLALKPFSDAEAGQLIAKMPENFHLSDEEQSWVHQVADGQPYLLQAALSILFRFHAENESFDVKRALQEFVEMVEQFFVQVFSDASEIEHMLLFLVALGNFEERLGISLPETGDFALILGQYERELRDLEERGLLRSEPGARFNYGFCSSVFEWWLLKTVEVQREEESAAQKKVFSSLLTHKQTEQLHTVLQMIHQQKLAFSKIEAWGRPLEKRGNV